MGLLTLLGLALLVVGVWTLICVLDLVDHSGPAPWEAEAEIRRLRNQTVRELFDAEAAVRGESTDVVEGRAREVWRP